MRCRELRAKGVLPEVWQRYAHRITRFYFTVFYRTVHYYHIFIIPPLPYHAYVRIEEPHGSPLDSRHIYYN